MFKRTKERLKMWDFYIASFAEAKKVRFENAEPNTASLAFNRLDFNKANAVFFEVTMLNKTVPHSIISRIRDRVEVINSNVIVNDIIKFRKYNINWNSPQMEVRLRTWEERNRLNREQESNAFNIRQSYVSNTMDEWMQDSVSFLYLSEKQKQDTILDATIFIQLINTDVTKIGLKEFELTINEIVNEASSMGVMLERIAPELYSLLKEEQPLCYANKPLKKKMFTSFMLSDDIVARFHNIRQGEVGDQGCYIVTDIYSKRAVFKMFKRKNTSAEVVLITGETGSGKSFMAKSIVVQLAGHNYYMLIDDVEGDEYTELANWYNRENKGSATCINMRKGGFVDPVPIPDFVGDAELDETLKGQAITFSKIMLDILIGESIIRSSEWIPIIRDETIDVLYSKLGVTDDVTTWSNSKRGSIKNVVDVLKYYIVNKKVYESLENLISVDEFIKHASILYARLRRYFEDSGSEAYLFSDPININEINKSELVVLQYNMKSTSPNIVDKTQMELMLLNSSILSYQRSIYCKYVLKIYNVKVKEEVQRWSKYPNADTILNVDVTGGRKMGDIILFITNDVGSMLHTKSEMIQGVFSNIQSFIVGAIGDSKVRQELLERLSAPYLLNDLNEISKTTLKIKTKGAKEINPYQYGFVCCLDKSELLSVGKVLLPPSVSGSKLFESGVEKK